MKQNRQQRENIANEDRNMVYSAKFEIGTYMDLFVPPAQRSRKLSLSCSCWPNKLHE